MNAHPSQSLSLSHRIQILLHIAIQHQLRVGGGVIVDQIMPIHNWGKVYGELAIMYDGRLPD